MNCLFCKKKVVFERKFGKVKRRTVAKVGDYWVHHACYKINRAHCGFDDEEFIVKKWKEANPSAAPIIESPAPSPSPAPQTP